MNEQSEANNPERCSCCTCGYTWVKGQHGGHSCAQVMEVTIADLRARLAKYEDAEGRPLRNALRYTNDGELAECPCCGSLDVGGANGTVSCYGCDLQITKPRPLQNAAEAWNKRSALKVQPSGLVLPERRGESDNPAELMFNRGHDHALNEVARLNSSPVSAELKELQRKSELFDTYAAEAEKLGFSGICELIDAYASNVSAGGVDERAAFEAELARLGYPFHIRFDTETGYGCGFGAEYWRVWQARASLSAPSHGEQVRDARSILGDTGRVEVDRLIGRLTSSDPDFEDCTAAALLLRRLVLEEINGPKGYATWKDAAVAERLARASMRPSEAVVVMAREGLEVYSGPNMNEQKVCAEIVRLAEISNEARAAAPSAGSQEQGE